MNISTKTRVNNKLLSIYITESEVGKMTIVFKPTGIDGTTKDNIQILAFAFYNKTIRNWYGANHMTTNALKLRCNPEYLDILKIQLSRYFEDPNIDVKFILFRLPQITSVQFTVVKLYYKIIVLVILPLCQSVELKGR